MINKPFDLITEFLNRHEIEYELVEHEAVFTSEQAAKIRGFSLHQGAKALLLKADGTYYQAVIPGDMRLDSKKLRKLIGTKSIRFATPEEVIEVMGCEIGSCYPFGNLINVKTFVDYHLAENEEIAFNPGVHTKSIKMKYTDYIRITKFELSDITL